MYVLRVGGRAGLVVLFLVAAFGLWASVAEATSYWGPWRYYTVDGWYLKNAAAVTVWDDGTGVNSRAQVEHVNAWCLGEDQVGAYGRLINRAGTVLETGGWSYNAPCDIAFSKTPKRTFGGYYHGKGITHALYNAVYSTIYTEESPEIHYVP